MVVSGARRPAVAPESPADAAAGLPIDLVLRSMVTRRSNFLNQLGRHASERPDEVALRFSGVSTTWADLNARVNELADGLHRRDVRFGDPIAIMMQNRTSYFQAVLAANKLGAICVPVDYHLTADEVGTILNQARPRVLLVDTPLISFGSEVCERLGSFTALIAIGRPEGGSGRELQVLRAEGEGQPAIDFIGLPAATEIPKDDHPPELNVVTNADKDLVSALVDDDALDDAARLMKENKRAAWLHASTAITRQLLSGDGEDPMHVIARLIQQIAEADLVNVVLPATDTRLLTVHVATGVGSDELIDLSYPIDNTMCQLVLDTGEPMLFDDEAVKSQHSMRMGEVVPIGAVMVLPLVGTEHVRGVLVLARLHGRAQFTQTDMEMGVSFANHAAVAVEMADIRSTQEQLALLEDRERIARDLHDHVIQQLFGAGLTTESVAARLALAKRQPSLVVDDLAGRLGRVVTTIDETISQIRTSIFELRGPLVSHIGHTRARILEVVDEVSALLGFEPVVSFSGPVDVATPIALLDDLVAVVREALTNVARHASATRVDVVVRAGNGELLMEFNDDGLGIGDAGRRSGLANMRHRAEQHGGSLTAVSPSPRQRRMQHTPGTLLRWTIPLG